MPVLYCEMLTTVRLVNTFITLLCCLFLFLWWEHELSSHSNFWVNNSVNYSHHAEHCISRPHLLYNWKFTFFWPPSPSPPISTPLLETTDLSSASISLGTFRFYIEGQSYSTVWFWLILLSIILSRSTCVVGNSRISFFFWLSNISLWIYQDFLIHSSFSGHLVHFHVFVIVKCYKGLGSTNLSLRQWFHFLKVYLEVGLLDHMVVLFLILRGTSVWFSTVAAPVRLSTNGVWEFSFLCILTNTS